MRYTYEDMANQFPDNDACLDKLFQDRYGNLEACPKCGVVAPKYYRVKKRTAYACKDCRHQLYPLVGTIFEKTTTPLKYWFHAMYIFGVSKNGVSAKELQRQIPVSYPTAHRMYKMIRLAMHEQGMLGDKGAVEVDEHYHGGRRKQSDKDNKMPIMAALENGPVKTIRTAVVDRTNARTAFNFLDDNVFTGSVVHTDESKIYQSKKVKQNYNHASIRHIYHEYSKNGVTTNHVESWFGHFKKSVRGTYNAVSPAYLGSYAAEFSFRYNHRDELIFPLLLARAEQQL